MIVRVTSSDVLLQYEAKLAKLQTIFDRASLRSASALIVLVLAIALIPILSLQSVLPHVPLAARLFPIPLAAAALLQYRRYRRTQTHTHRLLLFYRKGTARMQGNWACQGPTGEEFCGQDHLYARDLNIVGEGSLFELLCTARTAIGRRGLAAYLLHAPTCEELRLRQDAVRELQPLADLRERIALLGGLEAFESKWEPFEEWLALPPIAFGKAFRLVALVTSTLLLSAVVAGLIGLVPWINVATSIAPLAAFQACMGLLLRGQITRMIARFRPMNGETQVLREGLQLLEDTQFQSPKLRHLIDRVRGSSRSVRKLEVLLIALNERTKDWFYGPSLILMGATQLCMAIEAWRLAHRESLRDWLEAWGEFEALNALATYAYENPENIFPLFADETCFEATALGHPLLPAGYCVRNDITLNRDACFYIVSGSNMSGKSTLLRAIGVNVVLAFAGAPVRARSLRLSRLTVCASLSVVDSLLGGKSKFMAEVDRLRLTLEAATAGQPVLFLIDEIFSGTNSRDRRVAAEAVVRTLVEHHAIGALSTHDLALTEIANPELRGVNVHTGSRDGTDPLDFDYRLKPGITTEANALAIARLAGVPI
jgi:MutS domain V